MTNIRAESPLVRIRTAAGPLLRRARPVVERAWTIAAPLLKRKRKWPLLPAYKDLNSGWRIAVKLLFPPLLAFLCLVYGFYFALTAPFLVVPFAAPVLLLVLLSVWALPNSATPPTRTMEFFFAAVFVSLILWPNYLALSLPGLPWLTAIRLTGIPMAMLLLVSLSISPQLRAELSATLRATQPIWTIMVVFIVMQVLSLPLADNPGTALNRAFIQQVNWTTIFLVAVWVCRTPGRPQRYINLIALLAIPIVIVAVLEAGQGQLLWAGHVPSFLKVDDPIVQTLLSSHYRSGTGLYRARATFSTALGMAEYLALMTPFAIHYAVGPYSRGVRIAGLVALPVIFYVLRLTDARLGVVGFIGSFVFYSMMWALVRFRRSRGDLPSAAIVYSYPTLAALFMLVINSSHRINMMIFGGGAQAASDAAREYQLIMGVPKILSNPIGHGSGGAGDAMGYAEGAFVAVDNYYLSLGLEFGVVGLTAFLAIFLSAVTFGVRHSLQAAGERDPEYLLLVPITVALGIFMVLKSVYGSADNHPIVFLLLGMLVALSHRVMQRRNEGEGVAQPAAAAPR